MSTFSPLRRASIQANGAVGDAELLAFTLLEITRLRCEHLLQHLGADYALGEIHRDLGLAGYHASSAFHPTLRAHCLTVARRESDTAVYSGTRSVLKAMFEEAISACDALTAAVAFADTDHLHLAYLYVTSAAESLNQQIDALFPLS
jgi:hypothetical protein